MRVVGLFLLKLFIFSIGFNIVQAQYSRSSKDPDAIRIDNQLSRCLERAEKSIEMRECYYEAHKEWDILLNKYYNLLKNKLPNELKTKLLLTQRAWLAWRDKEIEFLVYYYGSMMGNNAPDMVIGEKLRIIKQRTLELKSFYKGYSDPYKGY